jgi:hypothetical protein
VQEGAGDFLECEWLWGGGGEGSGLEQGVCGILEGRQVQEDGEVLLVFGSRRMGEAGEMGEAQEGVEVSDTVEVMELDGIV